MSTGALQNLLLSKVRFEADELEEIVDAFTQREVKKGTRLLEAGKTCRTLWFIESGCARTFTETAQRDITSWFYPENQFLTSWHSYLLREPGFEGIEMLENGNLLEISYEAMQDLYTRFSRFERFGRLLMEEHLAFIDHFSRGYMFLSAKERYQQLLISFPDIELRVKLGQIASFLGISQETLSRIRSGK